MSNDNIDAIIAAPWDDGDVCHPADANALRAEVVRLRERDAAWEWLAGWAAVGTTQREVRRHSSGELWASVYASNGKDYDVTTAPDPVALATALDANWRKA